MTTWVIPGAARVTRRLLHQAGGACGLEERADREVGGDAGCADWIEGGIGPACERFGGTAAVAECGGRNQVEDSFGNSQLIDRQRREHGIERCTLALWRNDFRHRRRIGSAGSPYGVSEVHPAE